MKENNIQVKNFVLEIKKIEIWKNIYKQKLNLFYLKKLIQEELKRKRKQTIDRRESFEKKNEEKRKNVKKKNPGNVHYEKNKNCNNNNNNSSSSTNINNTNKSKNKFSIFFNNPLAYDNYFSSKKNEEEKEKEKNVDKNKNRNLDKENKMASHKILMNKTYSNINSNYKEHVHDESLQEKETFSTIEESVKETDTPINLISIINYNKDYEINDSLSIHGNLFNKNKNKNEHGEHKNYVNIEHGTSIKKDSEEPEESNEYQDFEVTNIIQEDKEEELITQTNDAEFFKNKKNEECKILKREEMKRKESLLTHSFEKQVQTFKTCIESFGENKKEKKEVNGKDKEIPYITDTVNTMKNNYKIKYEKQRKIPLFINKDSMKEHVQNMNGIQIQELFNSLTLEEKKAYYYENNKKINSMIEYEVMYGIPDCVRGFSWQIIVETYVYKEKLEIKDYTYYLNISNKYENTIKKDINRTYPKHILFKNNYEKGQRILFNVLKAYSNYNSELGYCQGMAFIVAIFILYMNEEDAFFMLISLLDKYKLNDLFSSNMPLLNEYLFIFDQLLLSFFPKIHEHLKNENVHTSMYASQWFITLFSYNINILYAIRIWDFFFIHNYTFLFKIALAFFKLQEQAILNESFEDILNRLKVLSKHVELNHLIKTAMDINISPELLKQLSTNYKSQSVNSEI